MKLSNIKNYYILSDVDPIGNRRLLDRNNTAFGLIDKNDKVLIYGFAWLYYAYDYKGYLFRTKDDIMGVIDKNFNVYISHDLVHKNDPRLKGVYFHANINKKIKKIMQC